MTLEHAEVRETLIKTTLDLMEKGGLEAVKARLVAKAVGISVGTVYNLFGSVDRLVLAANLRIYEHLNTLGEASMAEIEERLRLKIATGKLADTPRDRTLERLLGLSQVYIDFVAANAARWTALLAYNRTRGGNISEDTLIHLNALMDIIGGVLREVPQWKTTKKRRLGARALWSAVHGIVTTNYFGGDRGTARERTMELITMLLTPTVDGLFAAAPAE
jgi:AcrR family transcriptional regulator